MAINKSTYRPYSEKMEVTLEVLAEEFNAIRAGRANPKVLDRITVEYYGVDTPLQQVASVQVAEARMLVVTPWDNKVITAIEKAIQTSDLGINPQTDGKIIRLAFPPLTEERRIQLTKETSKLGEEAKVAIRNVRREAIDTFRTHLKNKEISEDDYYLFEQEIQKITDKFTDRIDEAVKEKDEELLEI